MSATLTSHSFNDRAYRAASLRQVVQQQLSLRVQRLWTALEAHAERRAQQHLHALANCYEVQQPTLAAELRQLANGAR
jgi:hypothetical protein